MGRVRGMNVFQICRLHAYCCGTVSGNSVCLFYGKQRYSEGALAKKKWREEQPA